MVEQKVFRCYVTYPHFPPRPHPPILLPHILLRLFHRSATAAPLSGSSITMTSCSPLSNISPKPFPTYFTMCVLSPPPPHGSPPAPLNIYFSVHHSEVNLHWPPPADAWMAAPDPARRPRHLIARPSTYAVGSTLEWWVGGVPLRDGDPLYDLGYTLISDLEFSRRSWSSPSLISAPLPPIPFLVQLYLSPTPSLLMGGVFFGRPSWFL